MKRYVTEFANEFLKNPHYPDADKEKIKKIVKLYERCLITPIEAVDAILKVHKEREE